MANKFGLALPAASALSAAILTIFNVWMRWATDRVPTPVTAPIWLDEPSRAADMVRDCERALAEMAPDDEDRSDVEINLASALALVALGSEGDEALTRACDLLAATLERAEPTEVYIGAARLVEAMGAKADRTGDIEGYDEALQLMLDAAGLRAQVMPGALPRALLISATHLSALSARAQQDGQPGRAARLHRDALEDLLKALELASPRGTVHALARLKFAALVDRSGANLDAAIALSRGSLRRLRVQLRDPARLRPPRPVGPAHGARRARPGAGAPRSRARSGGWTAGCNAARRAASPPRAAVPRCCGPRAATTRRSPARTAQAFDGLSLQSGSGAADLAAEWAAWADGRGDAVEAAQAYWSWIRAVADDARRRPLRAEKERRLAHVAGLAARAGERLIAAGRTRDAAVAFDLGRATLLTERMERDRDRLTERLAAAGHDELAARWEQASRQIAQADRDGFVTDGDGGHATVIGGRRFQRRFTSIDQVVLAEREELLRAIRRIRGFEDIDAPADFDDLRLAAAEGPLVYVSATDAGATAIVVTDAAEPAVLSLELDAAGLEPWLARLRDADEAGALSDVLAKLLPWLWEIVGEPLAAQIAPGSLVTLIPLGALALLPLHAMAMAPAAEGGWHDRSAGLVFRYAPNARVLARAQAQASALAGDPVRVLTVAVPDAPGEAVIAHARDESAAIAARWPGRTVHLDPGSRPAVLEAMDRCGIWHFACHGVHLPGRPLDSRLVLADGPLTLRTIFARPQAAGRLAVLSACRTATPDERLLDEVVGFPSALLQAGVGRCRIRRTPTSTIVGAPLLVLRFFDELARGVAPVRALGAGAAMAGRRDQRADPCRARGRLRLSGGVHGGAARVLGLRAGVQRSASLGDVQLLRRVDRGARSQLRCAGTRMRSDQAARELHAADRLLAVGDIDASAAARERAHEMLHDLRATTAVFDADAALWHFGHETAGPAGAATVRLGAGCALTVDVADPQRLLGLTAPVVQDASASAAVRRAVRHLVGADAAARLAGDGDGRRRGDRAVRGRHGNAVACARPARRARSTAGGRRDASTAPGRSGAPRRRCCVRGRPPYRVANVAPERRRRAAQRRCSPRRRPVSRPPRAHGWRSSCRSCGRWRTRPPRPSGSIARSARCRPGARSVRHRGTNGCGRCSRRSCPR